jgi:hypothetical protein
MKRFIPTLLLSAIPSGAVFAAYVTKLPDTAVSQKGFQGLIDYINQASGWFLGILLAVVVAFLIYAAFLYLTSGGDEEKTKAAKNYIIYAVVALAVGMLATGIVILVGSFFDQGQAPSPLPGCTPNSCPPGYYCSSSGVCDPQA